MANNDIDIDLNVDSRDATSELKRLNSALDSTERSNRFLAGSLSNLKGFLAGGVGIAAAAGVATAAFKGFLATAGALKDGIESVIQAELNVAGNRKLFADTEEDQQALSNILDLSEKLGLSQERTLELAGKLRRRFEGAETEILFAATAAAKFNENLGDAELDALVDKLNEVGNETEINADFMKAFANSTKTGAVSVEQLARTTGKSTEEINKLLEKGKLPASEFLRAFSLAQAEAGNAVTATIAAEKAAEEDLEAQLGRLSRLLEDLKIDIFKEMFGGEKQAAERLGAFVDQIKAIMEREDVQKFLQNMGKLLSSLADGAFKFAKDGLEFVIDNMETFKTVGLALVSLLAGFTIVIGGLIAAVGGLAAGFVILQAKWFGVLKTVGEFTFEKFNELLGFFKSLPDTMAEIGSDIIAGLIDGFTSMFPNVVQSITDIANSVTDTIKDVLDIQSPSRVMMEAGLNTSEGLAMGIEKGTPGVAQASESMASDGIVDPINDPMINSTGNVTNNNNRAGNKYDFNTDFEFNITFDSSQTPEQIERVKEEMQTIVESSMHRVLLNIKQQSAGF